MEIEEIREIFEKEQSYHLAFEGKCDDCGKDVVVSIDVEDDGKTVITGGALYHAYGNTKEYAVKCDTCFGKDPFLRQECEVFSRIVGYLRPIKSWNPGKKEEWTRRKDFKI